MSEYEDLDWFIDELVYKKEIKDKLNKIETIDNMRQAIFSTKSEKNDTRWRITRQTIIDDVLAPRSIWDKFITGTKKAEPSVWDNLKMTG